MDSKIPPEQRCFIQEEVGLKEMRELMTDERTVSSSFVV